MTRAEAYELVIFHGGMVTKKYSATFTTRKPYTKIPIPDGFRVKCDMYTAGTVNQDGSLTKLGRDMRKEMKKDPELVARMAKSE